MIKTIIFKEIRDQILSFRFLAGLVFVLVLFVLGSVIFCEKHSSQLDDYQRMQQVQEQAFDAGRQGLRDFYQTRIPLMKEPRLSQFFASGNESRYPQSLSVSPSARSRGGLYAGMSPAVERGNYKLEQYGNFDIVFIVGIVLSFLAIVLIYDAVSRDREQGTLRQQLSNPLPRVQILISKYLAVLLLLGLLTAVGFLTSLIVVQVLTGKNVILLFTFEAFLNGVLGVLFLSVFLLLGLWISSSTSKSATSLALLLLIWTSIVVLAPFLGGMVAQRFHRVTTQAGYDKNFDEFVQSGIGKAPQAFFDFYAGKVSEQGWKDIESFFEERDKVMGGMVTGRFNELVGQAESAESFNFYSPYGAFRQAVERLSNTGLWYHRKFFDQARSYQQELNAFVRQMDLRDPDSKHQMIPMPGMLSISVKPVDPSLIPKFASPSPHVSVYDVRGALPAVGYLAFLNVVFFFLALGTFVRADVR